MAVKTRNMVFSNIVKKEQLREVQSDTLRDLKNSLMLSAGPYGSTTGIIRSGQFTEYSKDGHTILESISYNRSIEDSIQKELTELTRHIVVKVGDGTTSSVVLSSLIFDELCKLEEKSKGDSVHSIPPYKIIESFKEVVDILKGMILEERRDLELGDVYKIAMVCTNNNKEVSTVLSDIYKEHGLDVFIDVGVSTNDQNIIKSYDGLTIEEGYSDPVYINSVADSTSKVGTATIRDARVYAFQDPIDTIEMATFFQTIIIENIIKPYNRFRDTNNPDELKNMIPTVIIAPKISIDTSTIIEDLTSFLYSFTDLDAKPPILVISNIGQIHYEIYSDLWRLCGCKPIKKYIDPQIQEKDIADGKAPTIETVVDFYGHAEEVKADAYKTTFINPKDMFIIDEEGERVFSQAYTSQVNFIEQELKVAEEGDSVEEIFNLKRRLNSLKANMVDYLVGGVTVTDRDSVRALVEDAVKNIRSAANNGVGYGANYEGLRAVNRYLVDNTVTFNVAKLIENAYVNVARMLYGTAIEDEDKVNEIIKRSLTEDCGPMNIVTGEFDGTVLSTIDSDIVILDVLSKIITVMFTTNQMLVQTPTHNMYVDLDNL